MSTDWKTRCTELVEMLDEWTQYEQPHTAEDATDLSKIKDLVNRTRAELAQPDPEGPTEQEAQELFNAIRVPIFEKLTLGSDEEIVGYESVRPVVFARAVLARWGRLPLS